MSLKRAAAGSGPSGIKRVRIADDPIVSDSEDLEFPATSTSNRRGIIAGEAYASDSEGDEDDERGAAAGNVEEDDLFATTAPEPTVAAKLDDSDRVRDSGLQLRGSAAKDKQYLDLNDVEGQEFTHRDDAVEQDGLQARRASEGRIGTNMESDEDEEEFADGDEHANDDDAPRSRRSKKGMGYSIDSFNMKSEMQDGKFTADGAYIANAADPMRVHDGWLSGVDSKAQIRQAAAAKARAEARAEAQDRQRDVVPRSRTDCLIELIESGLVGEGETVAGALSRLGAAKKRISAGLPKRKAGSRQARPDVMETDDSPDMAEAEQRLQRVTARIDRLTALSTALLDGDTDIYAESLESIVRNLRLDGEVARGWQPKIREQSPVEAPHAQVTSEVQQSSLLARPLLNRPSSSAQFRYRWTSADAPPGQANQVLGPFSETEMSSWIEQGYFGASASKISLNRVGTDVWGSWQDVCTI